LSSLCRQPQTIPPLLACMLSSRSQCLHVSPTMHASVPFVESSLPSRRLGTEKACATRSQGTRRTMALDTAASSPTTATSNQAERRQAREMTSITRGANSLTCTTARRCQRAVSLIHHVRWLRTCAPLFKAWFSIATAALKRNDGPVFRKVWLDCLRHAKHHAPKCTT